MCQLSHALPLYTEIRSSTSQLIQSEIFRINATSSAQKSTALPNSSSRKHPQTAPLSSNDQSPCYILPTKHKNKPCDVLHIWVSSFFHPCQIRPTRRCEKKIKTTREMVETPERRRYPEAIISETLAQVCHSSPDVRIQAKRCRISRSHIGRAYINALYITEWHKTAIRL